MLNDIYQGLINELGNFYPFNLPNSETSYLNSDELNKLREVIGYKNSHEQQTKWQQFINEMNNQLEHKVSALNIIQDPCFAGKILLFEEKVQAYTYRKLLSFHVSSIGNYFSIYGREVISRHSSNDNLYFDPIISVSPSPSFMGYFELVNEYILKVYKDYQFLNMTILGSFVEGLSTPAVSNMFSQVNIFQAFFSSENVPYYRRKGKSYFKFES